MSLGIRGWSIAQELVHHPPNSSRLNCSWVVNAHGPCVIDGMARSQVARSGHAVADAALGKDVGRLGCVIAQLAAKLGAHLTSDGSLRLFALVTLLNLPAEMLPDVLLLDEPELGLHPAAIGLIAGMIKQRSVDGGRRGRTDGGGFRQ